VKYLFKFRMSWTMVPSYVATATTVDWTGENIAECNALSLLGDL